MTLSFRFNPPSAIPPLSFNYLPNHFSTLLFPVGLSVF